MKFDLTNLVEESKSIEALLAEGSIFSDQKKLKETMIRKKFLDAIVNLYLDYQKSNRDLEEGKSILQTESDEELREMAKAEVSALEEKIPVLEEKIKIALIPPDPNDEKNVIVEVRAGAGGDEAGLFAAELVECYKLFAIKNKFQIEILSESRSDAGGVREVVMKIMGDGAYSKFKFEGGTHRVQRIPETENKGRVHTSTVTVAILPEVDELEVIIRDEDLDISVSRAGGAGGQHVNKTESAVRMVHIPTGIVVECQDERSQLKNREKALGILRSRVYAFEEAKRNKELSAARLEQVGTGDRSEKIRTYNFPQDRVTDHRIGENYSNLPSIMLGNIDDIVMNLGTHEQTEKLQQVSGGNVA
ncbi:peptide chain release factor 1 [Candidatus Gracilibacteria bacterium]|jgi:peptide chain release factor 1|nr:peptide chain release factor 1 [Candidatus Gracilibacteria bacterium]